MDIVRGLDHLRRYKSTVLTIGNFDGVHIGHQKVIRETRALADTVKGTALAVTFEPHPLKVIAPHRGMQNITSFQEKSRLLGVHGIDVVLCMHFDRAFSMMCPDDFVRNIIVGKLRARAVVVGSHYTFGRGQQGNTDLLRRRGRRYGFLVRVIRKRRMMGETVSSSRIRRLISHGEVSDGAKLLGRPFMIEGRVITGMGRGARLLQIPTANIDSFNELIPREGVYAVKVELDGQFFDGAANIGRNPTFGEGRVSYEVHIINFKGNILDRHLRMYFIDRIRGERKYPDINRLREEIISDIRKAEIILSSHHSLSAI